MIKKEIIGTRSNKLLVLEFHSKNKSGNKYKCICDCGNEKIATYNQIKSGRLKSCGCTRIKIDKSQIEKDLKIYTKQQIVNKYGFKSVSSLNARIKRLGIFAPRNNTLKHDYFKTWSHNMAYVLGFIVADAYIHNNRPYLTIELSEKDKELLQLIKKELNHSGEILKYTRYHKNIKKTLTSYKISIYSKVIIKDLNKLGVVSNKTNYGLFVNIDLIPEKFFYDFFRGWFDGDGSAGKSNGYIQITCNDINFIKKIQSKINLQSSIQKFKNYYNLLYCKNSSKIIYNRMYYDNCLCLNRKKNILKSHQ